MNYLYFIGIDISKNTLDVAVFQGGKMLFHMQIGNNSESLGLLLQKLRSLPDFSIEQALFCMEHTGIYNHHVLKFLHEQQANIWLESAVRIQKSGGFLRGKNDKIDSIRIAKYAYEKREEVRLWRPQRGVIQQLAYLTGLRNRLITAKTQLAVPIQETKVFDAKAASQMLKLCTASLRTLEKDLDRIDKAIQEVIASDTELKRLFAIVTSVDGIGKVTAVQMIVATGEFTTINNPASFACYAGIAPFPQKDSGTYRGKMRVSHLANKTMKTLLHLCAVSAINCDSDMKRYYQRKVKENKNKMSIINAVRNKLIWRIYACVKENRLYKKNYDQALA
jgi:transposase